jgi:hypothetical protein
MAFLKDIKERDEDESCPNKEKRKHPPKVGFRKLGLGFRSLLGLESDFAGSLDLQYKTSIVIVITVIYIYI